jgi:hypothetical protein
MIVLPVNMGNLKKTLPEKTTLMGWIVLALGVVLSIAAYTIDAKRGAFNNVILLMFLASLAGGGTFLVALEYVSGAVWSVPMRRVSEFLAGLAPVLPLFALPLFFNFHAVFHWADVEAVAGDAMLQSKQPYLNYGFFVIRFVTVMGIWTLFFWLFARNSKKQDTTRDQGLTTANIRIAAVFLPLFAVTVTVVAIDWMMSITPHWYSTIFGVYYFSGTVVCSRS